MTASITRLRSGGAVLELSGQTQIFPDWRAAADDADERHIPWILATPPTPGCGETAAASTSPITAGAAATPSPQTKRAPADANG